MEYEIVSGEDAAEISREVTRRLRDEWELAGGLQMSAFEDPNSNAPRVVYAQAMTRRTPHPMAQA
jgi:hypothetical protein